MSWDQQPAQPDQPEQPHEATASYEATQPYGPEQTQPFQPPTQPYGQPLPSEQQTAPFPQYPYGQPGPYNQPPPQWDQSAGYGGPYYQPYQPPKRKRTGLYVALGVIGVVVAAGVAVGVAATSSNSGNGTPTALSSSPASAAAGASQSSTTSQGSTSQTSHTLTVPTSAGPLHLVSNADTAQRIASIQSKLAGNSAYGNPRIGFYSIGSDDGFSVWMLAESSADSTVFRNSVGLLGPKAMAHSIATGAKMTAVTAESPGPLGGAMLCGKIPAGDAGQVRVCEWVDLSSYGWVYFTPTVNQADILKYTLYLRGATEQ